ncbi:hypothetical protein HOY80DRAFT_976761 [Tuber brumale]|nr:hypothetical protein HOY80DRAFT_976761 [Tuber brumale]
MYRYSENGFVSFFSFYEICLILGTFSVQYQYRTVSPEKKNRIYRIVPVFLILGGVVSKKKIFAGMMVMMRIMVCFFLDFFLLMAGWEKYICQV